MIKNKTHRFARRLAMTFLALFTATMGWAQLSGAGTEADPYRISSAADWNTFANAVNSGNSFLGEYLKLMNDITLNINNSSESDVIAGTMTSANNGTEDNWFSGTFDGDWKTITFNVGTEQTPYTPAHNFSPSAPFRVIDGATIKNLTVDGTIRSTKKYNSGLVGFAYNTKTNKANYITSCTSSITINCSGISGNNPDCSSSGFVTENKQGSIYFTNCIFNGAINKGNHTEAQKSAGFVSYNNGTKVYFTNCTMAGTIDLTSNIATFNRNGKDNYSNAYYINDYGNVTGCIQATTNEPTDDIVKKYTANNTVYYIPGVSVSNLIDTPYDGNAIQPILTYYGRELALNSDYTLAILLNGNPTNEIRNVGNYEVTIIANNESNYFGSKTYSFRVLPRWSDLQSLLNQGGEVVLQYDYLAASTDGPLQVSGTVTLDLNGHTIDRGLTAATTDGYVIKVNSGASLTITDNSTAGTGTIKGGNNNGPGGGIYNLGTLTLENGKIEDNNCVSVGTNYGNGGGIYSAGAFTMTGGSVSNNTAKGGGCGIYADSGSSSFNISGGTIEGNKGGSKGAGIRVNSSNAFNALISNCTITNNDADASDGTGGGVFLEGIGSLILEGCTITNNTAKSDNFGGGGFYSYGKSATATIKDCIITGNNAIRGGGGGMYNYYGTITIDGGTISSNISKNQGGGIYVNNSSDAKLYVKGALIVSGNSSTDYTSNNNLYLDNSATKITIDGTLGANALIAVSRKDAGAGAVLTNGLSGKGTAANFRSDNTAYLVRLNASNEAELYTLPDLPTFTKNTTNGYWNETANWSNNNLPDASQEVIIDGAAIIPNGCTAQANNILFSVNGSLTIADGGQLNCNNSVNVTVEKDIDGHNNNTGGWYFIASPVAGSIAPSGVTSLLTNQTAAPYSYDLFRFNQSANTNKEWENYVEHQSGFDLVNGYGYLYANSNTVTLGFTGNTVIGSPDVNVNLLYDANATFKGWNLVGNPFTMDAYVNRPYYKMNVAGNGLTLVSEYTQAANMIPVCTGIFVQAEASEPNPSVTFSTTAPSSTSTNGSLQMTVAQQVTNRGDVTTTTVDNAIVSFNEGSQLGKFYFGEQNAKLYIPKNDEEYAIVSANAHGEMPVNFIARENGSYTLTVNPENVEMNYLHLIDNMTGANIDLLQTPSYSFEARVSDYESRFKLVFSSASEDADDDNEAFAFISNGEIVITADANNATLQLIDMTGRVVVSYSGRMQCIPTTGMAPGVYVLRLIQGKNIKVQKIVVR